MGLERARTEVRRAQPAPLGSEHRFSHTMCLSSSLSSRDHQPATGSRETLPRLPPRRFLSVVSRNGRRVDQTKEPERASESGEGRRGRERKREKADQRLWNFSPLSFSRSTRLPSFPFSSPLSSTLLYELSVFIAVWIARFLSSSTSHCPSFSFYGLTYPSPLARASSTASCSLEFEERSCLCFQVFGLNYDI